MKNLIEPTEQYGVEAKEEINAEFFNKFMEKIGIWDYACVTKEHYYNQAHLVPNYEKEALIKKYYFEVKSRTQW